MDKQLRKSLYKDRLRFYGYFQELLVRAIIMLFFLILLASLITGCQMAPASGQVATAHEGVVYKYDMHGTVNGVSFDGVGVIPYSDAYKMHIESLVDVDLISITSCHRDFSAESAIKIGWFKTKRGYDYDFNPAPGIENEGSCLVRTTSLNKDKGLNAWGIVDFETPGETLPATSYCNGRVDKTNGVSICQTRAGLIQKISFEVPVRLSALIESRCQMSSSDNKNWVYKLQSGECVIAFQEIDGKKRFHRHTTVAYTDIFVRGAQ